MSSTSSSLGDFQVVMYPPPAAASAAAPSAPPQSLAVMLRNLTALPSGLASSMAAKGGRKNRKRGQKLAIDGAIYSRVFSDLASRPYPNNGCDLYQTVRIELSNVVPALFLTASSTGGISTYTSRSFALSDFNAASSLSSVFDQYRILQVEAWIDVLNPNQSAAFPFFGSAVDLDDANVPTAAGNVFDKQGALTTSGAVGHYHKWRPHTAVAVYSGAFTSFANEPSMWIDCASPNVQHYGLKATAVSNGAALSYTLTFRAVIEFRAPVLN